MDTETAVLSCGEVGQTSGAATCSGFTAATVRLMMVNEPKWQTQPMASWQALAARMSCPELKTYPVKLAPDITSMPKQITARTSTFGHEYGCDGAAITPKTAVMAIISPAAVAV